MITDYNDECRKANRSYLIGIIISITFFGLCLAAGFGYMFCWIGYMISVYGCRVYSKYRRQLVNILFLQYMRTLK